MIAEQCVTLAPAVRRIVAGNAGMMTGPGTNTYLLGTTDVAVLDPGPDDDRHLDAIEQSAARIRWIVVTHTHPDHSPLAKRLAERSGAELIGLPPPGDGRQDESFEPQRRPRDGERLRLAETELTVLHTPGHASNCVCYLLASERLLFTGDHILQGVSPVILPPDGDMSSYLDSLDKLRSLDFDRIAPGHGELMTRGKEVLAALYAHRLAREEKVLRSLAQLGGASLDQLTPVVYDDVAPDRHRWARLTLQAHLIKLLRDSQVQEAGGFWQLRRR